jgi:hypothetical protein
MHWPFLGTTNRYILFLAVTFTSACISFILSVTVWWAFGAIGQGGVFAVMFSPLLLLLLMGAIFVPFVVTPLYGLAKGRFGFPPSQTS